MSLAIWLALLSSIIVAAVMVRIDTEQVQVPSKSQSYWDQVYTTGDMDGAQYDTGASLSPSTYPPWSASADAPHTSRSCHSSYPSCWSSTLNTWNSSVTAPRWYTPLPPHLQKWQSQGRFLLLSGIKVYVQDVPRQTPPTDDKQAIPLVVFHGFPTSSYDFRTSLPHLTPHFRVILFDLPGFGLSEKPPAWSYSLMEQTDIVLQITLALGLTHVHLLSHDLGDSVCMELLARRDRGLLPWLTIHTVTLNNGGMILRHASPRIGQQLLRLPWIGPFVARIMPYWVFKRQVLSLVADPCAFPLSELESMWALVNHLGGSHRTPQTIGYIADRGVFEKRWLEAFRRLDIPCHIVWGKQDAVAPYMIALDLVALGNSRRSHDNVFLTTLSDAGHFAMIENSESWSEAVIQGILTLTKEKGGTAAPTHNNNNKDKDKSKAQGKQTTNVNLGTKKTSPATTENITPPPPPPPTTTTTTTVEVPVEIHHQESYTYPTHTETVTETSREPLESGSSSDSSPAESQPSASTDD